MSGSKIIIQEALLTFFSSENVSPCIIKKYPTVWRDCGARFCLQEVLKQVFDGPKISVCSIKINVDARKFQVDTSRNETVLNHIPILSLLLTGQHCHPFYKRKSHQGSNPGVHNYVD